MYFIPPPYAEIVIVYCRYGLDKILHDLNYLPPTKTLQGIARLEAHLIQGID